MTRLLLVALALAGCQRATPEALAKLAERLDYASMPVLPSPEANAYATGTSTPPDRVMAELLRHRHHDAGLASAAAGLALDIADGEGAMTRWELREALWRAGYPYPVYDARGWQTVVGGEPPRDLIAWIESTPAEEPMAMVRARGHERDAWVGLRSRPDADIGVLPRLAEVGTPIVLPKLDGATFTLADPDGRITRGDLTRPRQLLLTAAGEWLLHVRRDRVEIARFPIYVGVQAPDEPLLRPPFELPQVASIADAEARLDLLLDWVRDTYGAGSWERSPLFDAAVRRYVTAPDDGTAVAVAAVGFEGAAAEVWACDDVTVENCLDAWVWDVRRRATLLGETIDSYGVHTVLDTTGLHLTLLLVDTD